MKRKKIRIRNVDPEVFTHKGLFDEGCYGSECEDDCCVYGCDVDYESLKLIYKHRDLIEPLIKTRIEECFLTELTRDNDYVGGAYRETATRDSDGLCKLHGEFETEHGGTAGTCSPACATGMECDASDGICKPHGGSGQ